MTPLELCEQGSPRWREARCGLVTASRCAEMIATTQKGDEAAKRRDYRAELICEILTGQPAYKHITREMQWGADQEQFARAAYELERNVLVETCGFVQHPDIPRFGCSPDGLVGEDGLIQIKCPTTATHLGWILAGTIPLEHCPQMLAEMACTGRQWNDFVSYDPRLPKHLQLFIRRFPRDEGLIAGLEGEVLHFTAELDAVLAQLPTDGPQLVVEAIEWERPDELEF
jgi:hypothetical protein